MPQLADTAEVLALARTLPGLKTTVLVPDFKGAERAIAEQLLRSIGYDSQRLARLRDQGMTL